MATVRKRGKAYQIRVSAGYDLNGKQIIKTMNWTPPRDMTEKQAEKEVQKQAVLFEDRVQHNLVFDNNMRFADYAEKWFSTHKTNLAPRTAEIYKSLLERVLPAIGHIKLKDIQSHHLQEFYINLSEDGINKRTGGGLSANYIGHYHRIIYTILKDAYKNGYVLRNVAELVTPPKVKKKDIVYMDIDETIKFCETLEKEHIKWRTALLLLLYTGMRKGELCGLEWKDIDFKNKVIAIRRAVQYITGEEYEYTDEKGVFHKGRIIEKEPKTKSSYRFIAVDDYIINLLRSYRKWWSEQKLMCGSHWIETDKIFIRYNGGIIHPDSISTFMSRFVKENNLTPVTPHGLRHTNISILIENGIDIKTVSSRAGHSDVSTTGNIYAHQIQRANAKAGEVISLSLKKA